MTLHPNHHRLWKLNTGLQVTCALSFSTLPPDSRTFVFKWNTKLALIWKEDFGPLGNSPVLLLLAQVRRLWWPLYNSSTRLCVVLLMLDPSLSPFLVKFTQILELIFLTILIRLRFSRLVVHLFPSTQLSVNMLGYSTLWTASLVMNVCVLLSLWRVSMIVFWTTVRSAVFSMIVLPSEPNWDHFEDSGNLCRCFELISWLTCHHIIISWEWIGGFLLNVSQNHHN